MPKTTIYTLAEELNMSPSMVSRAFNPNGKISEEKRKIVLEAARKLGFTPNRFASRLSMKTVRIGIVINSVFQINTDKLIKGINNAYSKLKDYKVKYDIIITNPEKDTPCKIAEILSKYKAYDGIIITGMSSPEYTDIINSLYENNPNIVQVQTINNSAGCLFSSKHDEKTASELAAEFLSNCLKFKERKNILLFTGNKQTSLHSNAESAFVNALNSYGLKLIASFDMKDNEEYFRKILPDVFKKFEKDTDGIYITSGFSVPLCEYLEKEKRDIPLVTFDIYEDMKKYLERGIISSSIEQNVASQMEAAFEMLTKYIITGQLPEKIIYSDIHLVLKSNMNSFR